MKKNIFLFFGIITLIGCSTRKNKFANRTYHNFTTYYNTLFHGKEALKAEIKTQRQSHKDNFQEGYIEVFPENALALEEDDSYASEFFGAKGTTSTQGQNQSKLQKAEQKALKAIEKHSMVFGGEQKNKEIFNAYILLAEARIYQGKLQEALEPITQIYQTMPRDKRIPLAKIYEGLVYSRLKNHIRAEEIFYEVEKEPNLKSDYKKILAVHQANNLIASNRKEDALAYLDEAFRLNKKRETRSRIAFLRGQILSELEKKTEARESFVSAYKYSNNFEFEVKSQIEIAKTFSNGDDYEGAKKYLEDISKKGTYASRKNEFYYALGLIATKAGKEEEADDFFRKSVKEKISDPDIRGLAYFEIGRSYFKKDDYIRAAAYYDSALTAVQNQPIKTRLKELSSNVKNLAKNYYLIKKNDSIIALTKMSDSERNTFFQKHIDELKEKEAKQELIAQEKEKKRKDKEIRNFYTNNNSSIDFQNFSENFSEKRSGKFYFANEISVAKGNTEFKRIWGDRALNDNWRYGETSSETPNNSLADIENQTMGREPANARRFEIAYYLEQIPTEDSIILDLKKSRDTASLGLGRMYEAYFQNTPVATKTLFDLVDNQPEKDVKLQALYLIFSFNHEKTPEYAEKAKSLILNEFPNTPYAAFVRNPRNANFAESSDEVKSAYQQAYTLYTDEKFEDAQKIVNQSIEKYPNDALIPKFELLKAFITGKTKGKEDMIFQLQELVLNFERTNEGLKAKELLDFLKKQDNENVEKSEEQNIKDQDKKAETQKTVNPQTVTEPKSIPEKEPEIVLEKIEKTESPKKPEEKKENAKKEAPKKLERPVQSWEKEYLEPDEE